jgi:hypothetical protein
VFPNDGDMFIQHCSREHSDKLTLNDLLIQPVQRIPRYVLLLKDMLKHTPQDHPDHHHLLAAVSELTTLAEKMDQGEWEAAEAEKLKELESTFEGHVTLTETKRYVLCQDTVGQVVCILFVCLFVFCFLFFVFCFCFFGVFLGFFLLQAS